MNKAMIAILLFFGFSTAQAAVVNARGGDLYRGDEFLNEQPTGKVCYLYVDYVAPSAKGHHCQTMTVRAVFSTDRDLHPKDEITLESPVTNYHRPDYPQIKSCAMTTENKTSGPEIYGDDDTNLYVQFLAWNGKHQSADFDLFVTNSADTKMPNRVRLHRLTWFSEKNYDCLLSEK